MAEKEKVPLHPDFQLPVVILGGTWTAQVHVGPHFSPSSPPSPMQIHPRFASSQACGACNSRATQCTYAGAKGETYGVRETYEYYCLTCGHYTTYQYFD